jgi:hypothetical protein
MISFLFGIFVLLGIIIILRSIHQRNKYFKNLFPQLYTLQNVKIQRNKPDVKSKHLMLYFLGRNIKIWRLK